MTLHRRSLAYPRRGYTRGFTLIEIMIALAIAALTLVALNTLMFAMGELWGRDTDVRLFDRHVRAVTRFLDGELRRASLPPFAQTNSSPIVPQEVRPPNGSTETLLTFELTDGCRLIPWPDRPLPEVVCSLQARDRDGLWLLWHSRLEKNFTSDPPHETLITPYGTAISYDYYDPDFKSWKNETTLRRNTQNQYEVPQRIRIQFKYDKIARESVIVLPGTPEGLPNF